ncbi:MAG: phytanoyl-CoA dioxygenase [Planctomycetaceae bacterium]|nr:MAG: phytanoyl-CoA dioxygenase [Planctomycetaceae bacterium]
MPVTDVSVEFTPEELQTFQEQGWIVVRGLAPQSLVAQMRDITREHLQRELPPVEYEAELHYPGAPPSLDAEGGRTIRRLKQAHARGHVFTAWLCYPGLLRRLQQLVGPRVYCPLAHHNCIMTKQPQFSSETGWHQDIRYWSYTRPELVNAWLALGEEYPENGGMWVIPGSHRATFTPQQFDAARFFLVDHPENQPWIARRSPVVLQPGDVLFFHCLTLHAASHNSTSQPKWSVVFTFRGAATQPLPGSRSASSPELYLTPAESEC